MCSSCADFLTHHAQTHPLYRSPDLHAPTVVRSTSAGSGATPEYQHSKLVLLSLQVLYLFMYNTAFNSAQNPQHPFKQCCKLTVYLFNNFIPLAVFQLVSNDHFQFSFLLEHLNSFCYNEATHKIQGRKLHLTC